VSKRIALFAALVSIAAGFAVPAATASRSLLVGINDEANTLYGDPDYAFPILRQLRTQVLRVNLYWGGNKYAVANKKPTNAADPGDPAYDWTLYDRFVRYSSQYGIKVVFSILFTPTWANGGKAKNVAPTTTAGWTALRQFAFAAAKRYSGTYVPPIEQQDPLNSSTSLPLPAVRFWTAWNEPNNPIWLSPQWKKVGGKFRPESAVNYVKICNAVYTGVHQTSLSNEKVACGVTGPRGNNQPTGSRPSVDPLSFMRALKTYGLKKFDVYAHHPYYGSRQETPSTKPKARTAVILGNIDTLISQLTKLWGAKRLWITEYGYQTPPERLLPVTLAQQAKYVTQAYAIARKNPRIDMMLWFLFKDDSNIPNGWQSGFLTAAGKRKPSFAAFAKLPHSGF
jgi:hypothetical protein